MPAPQEKKTHVCVMVLKAQSIDLINFFCSVLIILSIIYHLLGQNKCDICSFFGGMIVLDLWLI